MEDNFVIEILLILIAAILAGLGAISIYMLKDTRSWIEKLSIKFDGVYEKVVGHLGNDTIHCSPTKAAQIHQIIKGK